MVYVSSQTTRKQYSFPSVTINEQVLSPANEDSLWRSTIGVAATFSKGPLKAEIRSRQEFLDLFGDDNSPGSIFMNQAMSQGATNFVVSRVVPSALPANGLIHLAPTSNIDAIEAVVSDNSANYTKGLTLSFRGVNQDVQPLRGAYLGYQFGVAESSRSVSIKANETATGLTDTNGIKGRANIEFTVLERVKAETLAANNSIGANRATTTNYGSTVQKVTLPANTAVALINNIKVNYTLTNDSNTFTVLTPAYKLSDGSYEFFIETDGTHSLSTSAVTTISSATGTYFIVGYKYQGTDSNVLPDAIPSADYLNYGVYNGFLVVDSANTGVTSYPIKAIVSSGTGLAELGFQLDIGSESTEGVELIANPNTVFTVNAINVDVTIGDFTAGTSALTILKRLREAILVSQMSPLLGEVVVNETNLPYSLSFSLATTGAAGNYISYTLSSDTVGTATDLNYKLGNVDQFGVKQYMVGGRNGSRRANLTLYDNSSSPVVYIETVSEGTYGNNLRVNVTPLEEGSFELTVYYQNKGYVKEESNAVSEVFILSNKTVDINTGIYPETLDSQYIRAFFVPVVNNLRVRIPQILDDTFFSKVPTRVAPINYDLVGATNLDEIGQIGHPNHRGKEYLQNLALYGGEENNYDLNNPDEIDISEAIDRLKNEDIAFVTSPHILAGDNKYQAVLDKLIAQVESATPYNGLRFAVVQAQNNLTLSKADLLSKKYNSKRLIILNGYSSLRDKYYLGLNTNSSVGYYVGLMAITPPHISPVAAGNLQNIFSVDTNNDLDYLDKITLSRIECLYLDPVIKTFKFLNGRTTAANLDDKWVSINRISDYLVMGLFRNLQWARSQPNNAALRNRVASACDAFLATTKLAGWIQDYSPTICNDSNNSAQDIARGKLNVIISYIPVFPADYINVNLVRTFSNEFSLDLTV